MDPTFSLHVVLLLTKYERKLGHSPSRSHGQPTLANYPSETHTCIQLPDGLANTSNNCSTFASHLNPSSNQCPVCCHICPLFSRGGVAVCLHDCSFPPMHVEGCGGLTTEAYNYIFKCFIYLTLINPKNLLKDIQYLLKYLVFFMHIFHSL